MSKKKYFNVKLEFDREKVESIVLDAIEKGTPGYVCAIESNNLTVANKNPKFMEVVNGALVNQCDGSVLAKILGHIHNEPLDSYIGGDLFDKLVRMKRFRQFYLGSTPEVLAGLKKNMTAIDPKIADMQFVSVPFRKVEDFDYEGIAEMINADGADIIWVSLGAPKQEEFMSRLLPYLKRGVMFGYGAVFNFRSGVGPVRRAPKWMRQLRLEWLYRAREEPKKNVPRYWGFIKILPRLIKEERKKVKRASW